MTSQRKLFATGIIILATLLFWLWQQKKPVSLPVDDPAPPPVQPAKPKRPRPAGDDATPFRVDPNAVGTAGTRHAPDGTQPQIDYPPEQWFKNIGSKKDGAGMCVFTSFEMAARWAGLECLRGFRDWCAQRYPGGGYPEKLAKLIKAFCIDKKIPKDVFDPDNDVVQYEGPSPEGIEIALRTDRMPCCTLYHSPRYGSGTIYHMVCCAHLDGKHGAINDNNYKDFEWRTAAQTIAAMKQGGKLWYVVILKAGPPPEPKN